jgi:hypothetical protein
MKKSFKSLCALAALACAVTLPASAAEMILVNTDGPGTGFNDPTPATPVGGNAGTTVGQQRLIAYTRALQLWGSVLKSDVPVTVLGSFSPRPCAATSGVLASAGAYNVEINFSGAPLANHWYHGALANAIAGHDLYEGSGPQPVIDGADLIAFFNSNLGTPGCLETSRWYYGLDSNANDAAGDIDFLNVFMHEMSHGLGFSNFMNEATGALFGADFGMPFPDVYMANTYDNFSSKRWNEMASNAERAAAAVRNGQEVWVGAAVTSRAPSVLGPLVLLNITAPVGLVGEYEYGTAAFGPAATPSNLSGTLVAGLDEANAAGPTANDGCTAFTNAAAVAGNIAVVKRGTCGFAVKAKNAQNAGASGVIIGNNAAGSPPGMAGADPTLTIATISVTNTLGDALISAGTATGGLAESPTRMAGADANGRVRLYAPTVVALGSSISHFDTVASPNLLMEPAITASLAASLNVDLTAALFEDIGWKTEISLVGCGAGSGSAAVDVTGEMYAAPIFTCSDNATSKGSFQSCTVHHLNSLRNAGIISGATKGNLGVCAAAGK